MYSPCSDVLVVQQQYYIIFRDLSRQVVAGWRVGLYHGTYLLVYCTYQPRSYMP